MKSILIVLLFAVAAFRGVREPSTADVQEALRLWQQYCNSGSTEGQEGSAYIFCKIGKKTIEGDENSYEINVTPAPEAPKQIIFVQAPPYVYKHKLLIRGGSSQPQQTKIYVVPSKAEHSYSYEDDREVRKAGEKPSLYFLNDTPGAPGADSFRTEDSGHSGANSPQIQSVGSGSVADGGYPYRQPQGDKLAYTVATKNPLRVRGGY